MRINLTIMLVSVCLSSSVFAGPTEVRSRHFHANNSTGNETITSRSENGTRSAQPQPRGAPEGRSHCTANLDTNLECFANAPYDFNCEQVNILCWNGYSNQWLTYPNGPVNCSIKALNDPYLVDYSGFNPRYLTLREIAELCQGASSISPEVCAVSYLDSPQEYSTSTATFYCRERAYTTQSYVYNGASGAAASAAAAAVAAGIGFLF